MEQFICPPKAGVGRSNRLGRAIKSMSCAFRRVVVPQKCLIWVLDQLKATPALAAA